MAKDFVDFDGVFGEDYLHFYDTLLTSEVSDRQAELIARLLDLHAGDRVLDVPCGHGRITERLAAFGCDVVGIDANPKFLERARGSAPDLDYREGDMRELAFESEFDAVVNWFTSFGYFDEATDRAVLRSWRKALKPGGRLLIDHQNRDRILPMLGSRLAHVEENGDDLLIDRSSYDAATGRSRTERITVRDGKVRRTHYSLRLFTPTELEGWLHEAGFREVAFFGAQGEPFGLQSARLVAVAAT